MDAEILDKVTEATSEVFVGTEIFLAYVYGSRVAETARSESDLDVGYYLEGYKTGRHMPIDQELILEAKLSEIIDIAVDLRNLGSAPLEVRGRVLEDGIRIFDRDEVERVNLERNLLASYHDYKPHYERMHLERLRNLAGNRVT